MKEYRQPELVAIRRMFRRETDPPHAEFHKNYHKSSKKFYGLRAPLIVASVNEVFPKRPNMPKDEALRLAAELWASDWFEEQTVGLLLIERIAKELTPADLPYLNKIVGTCEGWATTDYISTKILGVLAMNYPETIYPKVRLWTKSKHLWTRRAAILIHVLPARKKRLNAEYALSTFEELLHAKEFFIRKAIGWTLREIAKHYPEMTVEFLNAHRATVSGLTMREGARRLPAMYRKELGLK